MIRIITRVLLWKSRQWRHLWSNGPEPGWVGETRSETRPTQSSAAESSRSEYLKPVCTLGTLILPLDFKKHSSRGKWWTILYCRYRIVFFFSANSFNFFRIVRFAIPKTNGAPWKPNWKIIYLICLIRNSTEKPVFNIFIRKSPTL